MNQLIDEILTELKKKYGISRYELEKIIDSEFKCLENNIRVRGKQSVNMIHLGKFKPSSYFLEHYDVLTRFKTKQEYESYKQSKGNKSGMDESFIK